MMCLCSMMMLFSSCFLHLARCLRRCLGRCNAAPLTASPESLLLQKLPVEVLLLVQDELHDTPQAAWALSLTCKALYGLLTPRAPLLGPRARDSLLKLLEKDASVGSHLYFRPTCHTLHSFSKSWGPHTREHRLLFELDTHSITYARPCYEATWDSSVLLNYNLGYHHARLVVNRHLYGPPNGLPLSNLNRSPSTGWGFGWWEQSCSAKVIDNELFLCRTYTLRTGGGVFANSWLLRPSRNEREHQKVREEISKYGCSICAHGYIKKPTDDAAFAMPEPNASLSPDDPRQLFSPCQDVLGSCSFCLTDYYTTIKWQTAETKQQQQRARKRRLVDGWLITIVAYHQFGSCRSPFDWKWASMADLTLCCYDTRDIVGYPPGTIRDKWLGTMNDGPSTSCREPTIAAIDDITEFCPVIQNYGENTRAMQRFYTDHRWKQMYSS